MHIHHFIPHFLSSNIFLPSIISILTSCHQSFSYHPSFQSSLSVVNHILTIHHFNPHLLSSIIFLPYNISILTFCHQSFSYHPSFQSSFPVTIHFPVIHHFIHHFSCHFSFPDIIYFLSLCISGCRSFRVIIHSLRYYHFISSFLDPANNSLRYTRLWLPRLSSC